MPRLLSYFELHWPSDLLLNHCASLARRIAREMSPVRNNDFAAPSDVDDCNFAEMVLLEAHRNSPHVHWPKRKFRTALAGAERVSDPDAIRLERIN